VGSTREAPLPVCGLDIGSNTFSCAEIARIDTPGEIEVRRDVSLVVRLSERLRPGGPLEPSAVARGLETLERLTADFALDEKPLRAVGTEVLRATSDPTPFTEPAREILGRPIEIIDGEQEALLTSWGAIAGIGVEGPFAVCDVGGQSTEICRQRADGTWQPRSIPLGVVGLTERHLRSDPPLDEEIGTLRSEVRSALVDEGLTAPAGGRLIGVAGTATTLAMLELGTRAWQRERVHGMKIKRARVDGWLARMIAVDAVTRSATYGVRPGRSDVFPAGLSVLLEVLDHLGYDRFTVSANGLRIGAALTLLEDG
jgi:exopolyphosphatase/guanosine-5'-triphosphate,3'-diphosphate pyrophosphatase